jgi:hypothetical protein
MQRGLLMATGCVCMVLGAVGCATQPTSVATDPAGAFVSVDGTGVGTSPLKYTFDFNKQPAFQVTASKPGYFDTNITLTSNGAGVNDGVLALALRQDDSYTQTTTTEATNRWVRVQVADTMKQDDVWQKIVDSVTSRYSSIEQMDNASGYLRSVPISRTFRHPTNGDFSIRTQFLGAVSSRSPLVYKIKIVAERSTSDGHWVPFDRVFKGDAELMDEIQTRLGTAAASHASADAH